MEEHDRDTGARYIFLPGNAEMAEDGRSVDRHLIPRKNQCALGIDVTRQEESIVGDEPACLKRSDDPGQQTQGVKKEGERSTTKKT